MSKAVGTNSFEDNRFKTISDFKDCMIRGGEVEFEYNGQRYSITHPDGMISVCEDGKYSQALDCNTSDEALEFNIDGTRLRDIITEVKVWVRTI